MWQINKLELTPEEIGRADAALRLTLGAAFGGLSYDSNKQVLTVYYDGATPDAITLAAVAYLARHAPVFDRHVSGIFDRRAKWH